VEWGLVFIRAPFHQGMLRWCSIKCFTKGSLESDQGRERMVFGEYKKRNNKTTNYLPKKKES
jgi:hypothetical protein